MPPRKKRKVVSKTEDKVEEKKAVEEIVKSVSTDSLQEEKENRGAKYWLLKSEPETRIEKGIDVKFGIEDLKLEPEQTACWDGVRNYQARNMLRDQIKVDDKAFFYHSNCKPPGIVAIVDVVRDGYPDHTQFEKHNNHYDPKSTTQDPRWYMVDVKFDRMLKRYIPLHELKGIHHEHKTEGGALKSLALFTKARLSVQPLSKEEFEFIVALEDTEEI